MTDSTPRIGDLEDQLGKLKDEVDALQIKVLEARTPWHRNVSVLVSIVAVLFSSGATLFSYQQAGEQAAHDLRTELRGIILRLSALPKENAALYAKYSDNPSVAQQLGGSITEETLVLAKQGAELIDRIGHDATATEFYSVAYAFSRAGLTQQSIELLREGLTRTQDAVERVTLLRSYGYQLFAAGDPKGGRQQYVSALKVYKTFPEKNKVTVANSQAFTHLYWAQVELGANQCSRARNHIDLAENTLYRGTIAFLIQVQATTQSIASQCPTQTTSLTSKITSDVDCDDFATCISANIPMLFKNDSDTDGRVSCIFRIDLENKETTVFTGTSKNIPAGGQSSETLEWKGLPEQEFKFVYDSDNCAIV
jgi:hypothetical protein